MCNRLLGAIQEGETLFVHWLARFAADRIDKLVRSEKAGLGGRLALPCTNSFS